MSINTVAVPLQGRAWANDSIGGLAAGQQDKHNTHIFIRQLHAGHMATCWPDQQEKHNTHILYSGGGQQHH